MEDEDGEAEDVGGEMDKGEFGDGRRRAVADGGSRWGGLEVGSDGYGQGLP